MTGVQTCALPISEVNVGVTQLDQVAQRNASMVEQSASTTVALQGEAIGLDKLVSQFTTKPDQTMPGTRTKTTGELRAVA